MDDTATHTINPAIFDANLASLWAVLPASAEVVAAAPGPLSLTLATGRDGSPTFAWSDDAGVPRWLGRTSMPSISGPALVDSFEPGPGNVLLFGLGQGAEAWHLLDRMAAHQAVLIIEPSAWTVAAAFRLHDFSEALRRQRLLIFTDEDPWASCRDFLLAHDGFLVPDRILAWPWFEPHEVARVTNRLSEIQTEIARHRVDAPGAQSAPPPGDPHDFAMAIVSNVPDARVHRLARQLSHAAAQLGWRHCCCVLDTPAGVHPRAVERAVREITPNRFVLIDMLPDSFQALPPDASVTIVCSHPLPLSDDWLGRIPPSASLAVRSDSQRQGALRSGLSESRVILIPPAAMPAGKRVTPNQEIRLAVIGDDGDTSARAVGLHLVSHCRLWVAAEAILNDRIDTYRDADAERVFAAAEQQTGIRLKSDEVRHGMVERIRHVLGPIQVRRAYCEALADAGFAFDLYGTGWQRHARLRACLRGPWPPIGEEGSIIDQHGLIVSIETSGHVPTQFLDALAGGLAGFARSHPKDTTADGLAAILDPDEHVWRFTSRKDMVDRITRALREPNLLSDRRTRAAAHINHAHTWTHRLQTLVHGVDSAR